MAPLQVEVFLASLKRCLAVPGFMDGFYERFVGSSAEVREKFRDTDMTRQAQVLADTLYVVANAVQGKEGSPARRELPRIAARHSRTGLDIRPGLYDLWISCLVETVRSHDPQFDPEVERAWGEVLTFGANYMRHHY
ncbi:MAG TPA: globin domain-containing protein [Vicinamibacteria bacterium]|nr:globin domain-containing protein [Vicinamibacteria bacterium]